jgi:hypothetical protein
VAALTVLTPIAELRINMKSSDNRNLVFTYIYLAAGCVVVGTVVTFLLLLACEYFGVDIFNNLWLLAIPSVSALFLNVLFIELYHKFSKR